MEIRATTTSLASCQKVDVYYNDVKFEALGVFLIPHAKTTSPALSRKVEVHYNDVKLEALRVLYFYFDWLKKFSQSYV